MYEKAVSGKGEKAVPNEAVKRVVKEKVAGADILNVQTARTLEDAAPKVRMAANHTTDEG